MSPRQRRRLSAFLGNQARFAMWPTTTRTSGQAASGHRGAIRGGRPAFSQNGAVKDFWEEISRLQRKPQRHHETLCSSRYPHVSLARNVIRIKMHSSSGKNIVTLTSISRGFSVLFLMVLATGCAAVGVNKTDYRNRLKAVELGMSKVEFISAFPESIPRGAKQYPNGAIEVLEVAYQSYAMFPSGDRERNEWTGMEAHPQWFYIYNGKLIQYGNPNDWPANPDLIIETRSR
jgi:hypothetical protein